MKPDKQTLKRMAAGSAAMLAVFAAAVTSAAVLNSDPGPAQAFFAAVTVIGAVTGAAAFFTRL